MLLKALCLPPRYAKRRGWEGNTKTKLIRIMKLTGILLFAAALHVSAASKAQTVTYSAKTTPLVSVFAAIEQQTGYVFFYNSKDLQGTSLVTVSLQKVPLKDALEQILATQPVTFDIQGNTIAITRKTRSTDVGGTTDIAAPPPGEVHGHVTDSVGRPLEGANVQIKGDKHGAQTDKNGDFVLKNAAENATLIISNIGYEAQTVKLTGGKEVRVTLRVSQSQLDQVVFKGYYNSTNRLNTGDVTTVSGETINQQPVTDPILALEGRVPGLYIQQTSGAPGAYSTIRIMGQNSISNGNDPLYIVDGVPFSSVSLTSTSMGVGSIPGPTSSTYNANGGGLSPFNTLNPADIENIEVLKDADATAIYGSRGANGVILITTKRGKAGATRFDMNVYSGAAQVTRMLHLMNTPQYLEMRREAFKNDGLAVPSISTSPSDNNYDVNGFWDTNRYTNWEKVLVGNANNFTNAQASVSGGTANTQFVVGGGYSKQGTVFLGNFFDQKASARVNLTHVSTNQRFHLQLGASYVYDNSDLPTSDFTNAITLAPDAPALYNADGSVNWAIYNGTATFGNPIASSTGSSKAASTDLISNLNLSFEVLPGLQLKANLGYNKEEMYQSQIDPSTAVAPPNNANSYSRSFGYANSSANSWIIEPQLNYKDKIGLGRLETLVGSTFQQNVSNSITGYASGYSSDALIPDPLAAAYTGLQGASFAMYRYEAVYGRLGYNVEDKYIVNFTARRDGSSRFGPSKQFGNFGAAGIGWIFSKERMFADHFPGLSFGKIRASYGVTGNDQIGDYQYLSAYSPDGYTYEGIGGLYPTQLTNPYFAWEVVKKLEAGLDLGFLKDRILVSGTVFRNRTGNQLVGESLPEITGFGSVQFNLPAIVQNTGLELSINTINIQSNKFKWATSANLTISSNKLVAFPDIRAYPAYYNEYVIGKPLFILRVDHYIGVNPETGLYTFATKNVNGSPSNQEKVFKTVTQKFYGGIQNKFTYNGFQLDIFVQFVNQLGRNYQYALENPPGVYNTNQPTDVLSRWTKAGDVTAIQRFTTNQFNSYGQFQYSDGVIVNASFVRLKNLALSYTLPNKWMGKSFVQNVRVYLQCQNLLTITNYPGLDPETGGLTLPPLRMVTAGVQVNL
jgi:TonB-dependent starch-binding outer membrane protein SusC